MSNSITYMYSDPFSTRARRLQYLIAQLEKLIPNNLREDEFSNLNNFVRHFSQLKDVEQRLELERFVQHCQQIISYALYVEEDQDYHNKSNDFWHNLKYYQTLKTVDYYAKLDPHLVDLKNCAIIGLLFISILLMEMFDRVYNGTNRVLTKNQSMFLVCTSVVGTCLLARPLFLPYEQGITVSAEKFSLWVSQLGEKLSELEKLEKTKPKTPKCKV